MAQAVEEVVHDIYGEYFTNLRQDPATVCAEKSILLDCKPVSAQYNKTIGGPCKISLGTEYEDKGSGLAGQHKVDCPGNDVIPCMVEQGKGDWYYPYMYQACGEVTVPINQPEGTMVVTGGMNGCEIRVYRDGNNLRFFHDANGKNFIDKDTNQPKAELNVTGNEVCYIKSSDYIEHRAQLLRANTSESMSNVLDKDKKKKKVNPLDVPAYALYTIIFVYTKSGLKAYATGVNYMVVQGGKKRNKTVTTSYMRIKLSGNVFHKSFGVNI
jgi:hypothetical protein